MCLSILSTYGRGGYFCGHKLIVRPTAALPCEPAPDLQPICYQERFRLATREGHNEGEGMVLRTAVHQRPRHLALFILATLKRPSVRL